MSTWLVVGLGNAGPTYVNTRHNIGFMVVDELARRSGARWQTRQLLHVELAATRVTAAGWGQPGADSEAVHLMKSRSFMNTSGKPVAATARKLGVDPEHLIVVHDELDLDLDRLRVKSGGGDNGHNGLKSIRQHLQTGDYARVRVGIGRPPGRMETADWVLGKFSAKEATTVDLAVGESADAVESLISDGLTATQNRFNR